MDNVLCHCFIVRNSPNFKAASIYLQLTGTCSFIVIRTNVVQEESTLYACKQLDTSYQHECFTFQITAIG